MGLSERLLGGSNGRPAGLPARLLSWAPAVLALPAGLLTLRLLFRLMIANPANPVTPVVLALSRPFLFPWSLLWPPTELPVLTVERATVVALVTYLGLGLVLGVLGRTLRSGRRPPKEEFW